MVSLEWDTEGRVRRLPDVDKTAPRFTATKNDWLAFIRGEFTATMGLLRGRISFEGQLRDILGYSDAFNNLAIVARRLLPEQGRRPE